MVNKTVAIVGLGVIGGSLALNLRDKVNKMLLLETNEEVQNIAIAKGFTTEFASVEDLKEADVVVLCLYPLEVLRFLKKNKEHLKKGQVILDVGGVKGNLVAEAQEILGDEIEFLGTHPMAGTEGCGIKMAREELFLGSNLILTPTAKNTPKALEVGKELGALMGVRNIYIFSPEEHDSLIAYTSQLPHILAVALVNNYLENSEKIIGGSYRDATRVANINAELWSQLFILNKQALVGTIDKYLEELTQIKDFIEAGDELRLSQRLKESKERKEGNR